MKADSEQSLIVTPIGFIRSPMTAKFDAPHQPDLGSDQISTIELVPKRDLHKAVTDLEGFDYIWLVWWFHKNRTWKPKVQPPRGESTKRGVLSTRSPHRPNPLGISAVKLISVEHLTLTIGACDLVDGTPILDIKPYLPRVDSFPQAKIGWLEGVEESYSRAPAYNVELSPLALEQSEWLARYSINFLPRAIELLSRDPSENRTRRIRKYSPTLFRMGCAEWRIFFSLVQRQVTIEFFNPGYALELLEAEGSEVIRNRDVQIQFLARWPDQLRRQ